MAEKAAAEKAAKKSGGVNESVAPADGEHGAGSKRHVKEFTAVKTHGRLMSEITRYYGKLVIQSFPLVVYVLKFSLVI